MSDVGSAAPAASCWSCHRPLAANDHYCGTCGQGQGAFLAWQYRPLWIFVLAFTALGPLALPLVWRTPRFDRATKWMVTVVLVVITVYVGWQLLITVREVGRLFEEL
jgi:hypothetical protein